MLNNEYFDGLPNRLAQEGLTEQLRSVFSNIEAIVFCRQIGHGITFNAVHK